MILQVHDELLIETYIPELEQVEAHQKMINARVRER